MKGLFPCLPFEKVDASDLPFRAMCLKGGATATYTQMYLPAKLETDVEYWERALRDLEYERTALDVTLRKPTIVQLGGCAPEQLVSAARLFQGKCDGFDINAGCPQKHAMEGGYGSALLAQAKWRNLAHIGQRTTPSQPSF